MASVGVLIDIHSMQFSRTTLLAKAKQWSNLTLSANPT